MQRCTFRREKRNTETKPHNEFTVASVLFPWQAKDCSDRESGKGEEEEEETNVLFLLARIHTL